LFDAYIAERGMPFLSMNELNFDARKTYLSDVYSSIVLKVAMKLILLLRKIHKQV